MTMMHQPGRVWLLALAMCALNTSASARPAPDIDMRGLVSQGVILNASLAESVVTHGVPAHIELKMRNVMAGPVWFGETSSLRGDYAVILQDAKGRIVAPLQPRSDYRKSKYVHRTLDVGETARDSYVLEDQYSPSIPGRYYVTSSRQVQPLDGGGCTQAVSNTIALTIPGDVQTPRGESPPTWTSAVAEALDVGAQAMSQMSPAQKNLDHYACGAKWKVVKGVYSVVAGGRKVQVRAGSDLLNVAGRLFRMAAAAKVDNGELWLSEDGLSVVATLCVSAKLKIPLPPQLR